jgi:hypothetical protein
MKNLEWSTKLLIISGIVLVVLGLIKHFWGNPFGFFGRLPGDIRVENKNGGGFYFPWVSCLVITVILNLILFILKKTEQ